MKNGTTLETERLVLRHWQDNDLDRNFFYHIMSNEAGRRLYPDRMSRETSDLFFDQLVADEASDSLKWCLTQRKSDGERLGFTGLRKVTFAALFTPNVETGWQYSPSCWGNGYASEAANALLKHGFDDLQLEEIVAFTVPMNHPSIAVMQRIGMTRTEVDDFIHPSITEKNKHLKQHVLYRISAEDWAINRS